MPEISIEHATFERLQGHARPLVDTVDSVINRGLDALDQLETQPSPRGNGQGAERVIDPRTLPNLTHTKVLDATIDGERLTKPNWNALLDEMLRRAMKRLGSFEKLQQVCPVNMVRGRKGDEGYGYLPDIDVSVQGQDSNAACRGVVVLAQSLGIAIDIAFMWRAKDKAAFPGERGRLTIRGRQAQDTAPALAEAVAG